MMKEPKAAIERQAARAVESFLVNIPRLQLGGIEREGGLGTSGRQADIVAHLIYADRPMTIAIEVKGNGQPRIIREAAQQIKRLVQDALPSAIPMVVAPYLSEQARAVCCAEAVAYLDFMGNARLAFDTVYVERQVEGRPEPERRALRSLFKPKSARILRVMLEHPDRHWRMVELAKRAGVSLGLVSTIGSALRTRDWADQSREGLHLTGPDRLLDAWVRDYEPPRVEELRFYTHLHGNALIDRLRGLPTTNGRIVLASYSAADWLAPYTRHATNYFYADEQGLDAFQIALDLNAPPRGANIVIRVPDDDGVLLDAKPVAANLWATSPVQTYLDIAHAGERGAEAAQYLRQTLLQWRV